MSTVSFLAVLSAFSFGQYQYLPNQSLTPDSDSAKIIQKDLPPPHQFTENQQVTLIADSSVISLDEIVVVAYGQQTKESITGSAVKVSGEVFSNKNQSELTKALAGEVAGLQVFNTSGQPGSIGTIRIRGFGSANSSRDPLFVVDGAPYDGDISAINPADIESATVLKDAAAAALYGSRAANGVIIINTKRGSRQNSIEVDFNRGINIRLLPLYETISSPERYAELGWESLRNYGMLANGLSQEQAGVFASENIFNAARGIAPQYNLWNCAPNEVINPATGQFSGATRKYTPENWADYMFRTGQRTTANIRFSCGTDLLRHYTSFGVVDEEGYFLGSDLLRLNVRNNLEYKARDFLRITANLSYAYSESNSAMQNDIGGNTFYSAIRLANEMPTIYSIYERDADGNKIPDGNGGFVYDYGLHEGYQRAYMPGYSPRTIALDQNKRTASQTDGKLNFEIPFHKNFTFLSANSFYYLGAAQGILTNPYYGIYKNMGGKINRYDDYTLSVTNTQMLRFNRRFADNHSLGAFAGHESSLYRFHSDYSEKSMLANATVPEFTNAVKQESTEGYLVERTLESYFAQVKYNFDEKYFADVSFRRDGSSRFKNHKWGNFGSAGAAWIVSKETFMDNIKFINNLRLKASYGIYGNENINLGSVNANYYPSENLSLAINDGQGGISYVLTYTGNPDLTWEKSSMFNAGLDFILLDHRVEGEIEFFGKRTSNMIFARQMAPSLGYAFKSVNDALLSNSGVEFNFTGNILKTRDWNVSLSVNGAHCKNRILQMPKDETGVEKTLELKGFAPTTRIVNCYGWAKGHSLYDYYLPEYAGVNPETGQAQWYVYADDGTKTTTAKYSEASLVFVGKSAIPDLTGAFALRAGYKNLSLAVQFLYNIGGYGYDYEYAQQMVDHATVGYVNWNTDIERRWTTPGQITDVPRLTAGYDADAASVSSRFLTSMSYLSLNNLRVEYDFKLSKFLKLGKFKVWLSADNLWAKTARQGYYPTAREAGESDATQYIGLSTITAGLKIAF
ncbi:MAG: SusC/RagA family TonB-linked outer membrane protein [Dysgonamonadaceae bacterium]|jgi:TonB-linked SusC/RagA family outer membrane protein|nr:SusC/RagA family TonB-linked outer membrane protein [Dysgonamonadaceae bacterium]